MKKIIAILVMLLMLFMPSVAARAEGDEFQNLDNEINELKQKIEAAQSQERTLSVEIKVMDNKIQLTELQIKDTEKRIAELEEEIEALSGKIERLEITLSHLSEILINRVVTSYKIKRISYLSVLFTAEGLSDLLNRTKYIQMAQEHDREVLTEVQSTKVDFSEKKELRETKKAEQESLKKELEAQKIKLNDQRKAKQALLTQTKNDEATYQRLLEQALAEKRALEAALISGQQVGPVKTGDPIALVGNTGYPACSTGPHLHFELQKNHQWTNPADYLKSKSVVDYQNGGGTTNLGSGSWEWPLEGEVLITQFYGQTPYSWRYTYSGGIHTGIDMYSNSSSVIRAPKDGILYSSSQNCGASSIIKIKYIEHGDGVISFYLHVQ